MNLESMSDGQLLRRFSNSGDQFAFEQVVVRHGNMVAAAARRVVKNSSDAEDCTQAVFIVLARKAVSLHARDSVAGWLHHVALNIAMRARKSAAVRHNRERETVAMGTHEMAKPPITGCTELQEVLDGGLDRLPEKYRQALILHHLEGQTVEQTASALGTPVGTAATWIMRGRSLLRRDLERSGIVLSAGAMAAILSAEHAPVLSSDIISRMAQIAARAAIDPAAANVSPQAAALSEGELNAMSLQKFSLAAVVLLCLLLTGASAGLAASADAPREAAPTKTPTTAHQSSPANRTTPKPIDTADAEKAIPTEAIDPNIAALILQLADEAPLLRDEALNKLKEAGGKAVLALEAAAKHENYDISTAASRLLGMRRVLPVIDRVLAAKPGFTRMEYSYVATGKFVMPSEIDEAPAREEWKWRGYMDGSKLIAQSDRKAGENGKHDMSVKTVKNEKGYWEEEAVPGDIVVVDLSGEDEEEELPPDLVAMTRSYFEEYNFTHCVEKVADGEPVYELTGTAGGVRVDDETRQMIEKTFGASKENMFNPAGKIVIQVSRNDHLLRNAESFNELNQSTGTLKVQSIKLDPEFPAGTFDYAFPPGAPLIRPGHDFDKDPLVTPVPKIKNSEPTK
jgi:RNA polymerase sigma factor (sigma-70 family)